MDRQKKLIIVGAAGLLLLVAMIALVVLAVRGNKQPIEPEPTPIETIDPVATPTEEPTPTPEPTPVATPTAPVETPVPEPEETVAPSPSPDTGAPTLPGGSSSTPKPTQKPITAPSFDFSMPSTATVGAKLSVTASAKNIAVVEWILIKRGDIEIEVNANSTSDADAALTKDGGSISFKNTGSYMLKAIAMTTEGLKHTVSRNIEVSAAATASTPAPGNTSNPGGAVATGGFAFGLPKKAYTDTVVTVSVLSGTEAVTWSVTKDGSEVALSEAFAGKLTDDGGMIVFKGEGVYTLTGTTTNGSAHAAIIAVSLRKKDV